MINLKLLNPLINQISEEKGLPKEQIIEAVEAALAAAYKKEYGKKPQIIKAKLDLETGETKFYQVKIVVSPDQLLKPEEEENQETLQEKKIKFNPDKHILLDEAKTIKEDAQVGDEIIFPLEAKENFSRIAAQTAKQVILQKLHELEKNNIIEEFKDKENKIVSGIIQRIERNIIYVDLGKTFGVLFPNEAIPGEHYKIGERKKFYVLRLENKSGNPVIILSRSHPKFVSKLFEMEVPEISEGLVEIKSISREPGSRTKIAVAANDENIDPVGSCVGQKGTRVATIIDELNGERIDVIPYSEEPTKYVADALGPAKVKDAEIFPDRREIRVFVPPDQISLAIGKNGQNVRLAAKLTGWKIDVRSQINPNEIIVNGTAEADEINNEEENEIKHEENTSSKISNESEEKIQNEENN
ncbi:MAG: transcription termination factor NusA [Minisyncoccia bacterium]